MLLRKTEGLDEAGRVMLFKFKSYHLYFFCLLSHFLCLNSNNTICTFCHLGHFLSVRTN